LLKVEKLSIVLAFVLGTGSLISVVVNELADCKRCWNRSWFSGIYSAEKSWNLLVRWLGTLLPSDCVVNIVSRGMKCSCWAGFTAGRCLVYWVVHCILLLVVCSMFVRFDTGHVQIVAILCWFMCVCSLFEFQTTLSQSRSFIGSWQLARGVAR